MTTYEEHKLIRAYFNNDALASKKIYEHYKVYLFGICMRYAKSKMEAEDILQDAFMLIFKDIKSWSGKAPLRAWMRRVTINAALMHIRKYRKFEFYDLEHEKINHLAFEVNFSGKDLVNHLIGIIQQLPEPYQTVFNLRAIDDFPFKEIATKLQAKEVTVRSYYLRARKKLKILIEKELQTNP